MANAHLLHQRYLFFTRFENLGAYFTVRELIQEDQVGELQLSKEALVSEGALIDSL
jgi:hypothetical protein